MNPIKTWYRGGTCENHWRWNDNLHREDGPAVERFDKNGNLVRVEYYINGQLHREDGPAWIVYSENGSKIIEKYYINNNLHREDGPARIWYNADEIINEVNYYINDVELSKEEWALRVDPLYKELI